MKSNKYRRDAERSHVGFGALGRSQTGRGKSLWLGLEVCCWLIVLAMGVLGVIAFAFTFSEVHWTRNDLDQIVNKGATHVVIDDATDLIVSERVLSGPTDTMFEKITLTPVVPFFPAGPDMVFGDQAVTYARVQADLAIGFRLATPGNGATVFLEPGLKVLIEPFGVHIASPFFPFFGVFVFSDERIKENVADLAPADTMRNVLRLQPHSYTYKDSWRAGGQTHRGFIAQEVADVLPRSVQRTNGSVDGMPVSDLLTVRKEDFATELVGAVHHLFEQNLHQGAQLVCGTTQTQPAGVCACLDGASAVHAQVDCGCAALLAACAVDSVAAECATAAAKEMRGSCVLYEQSVLN